MVRRVELQFNDEGCRFELLYAIDELKEWAEREMNAGLMLSNSTRLQTYFSWWTNLGTLTSHHREGFGAGSAVEE